MHYPKRVSSNMKYPKGMSSNGPRFAGQADAGQSAKPVVETAFAESEYLIPPPTSTRGTAIHADDGRKRFKVGTLTPDGILIRKLKRIHILKKPAGIAFLESTLYQLQKLNCHTIRAELHDGKVLITPLERFFEKGIHFDRGFGLQIVLPLKYWDSYNNPQGTLF